MRPFVLSVAGIGVAASVAAFVWLRRDGGDDAAHRRPGANLIVFSIDTCRADHLSLHGYRRETSPALERFAERAIVFESAIAAAPVTAPSHMSIFTGLPPTVHGVRNYGDGPDGLPRLPRGLPDGIETLAQVLREKGYRTGAFTGGGNVNKELGFGRGFDTYLQGVESGTNGNGARDFDPGLAFDWVQRGVTGSAPFFLFLHTYIPHSPYLPPPPYDKKYDPDYAGRIPSDRAAFFASAPRTAASFATINDLFWNAVDTSDERDVAHLVALYDGEINASDDAVSLVLARLESLGLDRDTVVVLTSDHGELFGEHGEFRHPGELWEGLLRVPLVFALPGSGGGRRVTGVASALDVFPTILDVLGLPIHPQPFGRSLFPIGSRGDGRVAVSEHVVTEDAGDGEAAWEPVNFVRSLRGDRLKLIRRIHDGVVSDALFDVVQDPGETTDLSHDPERAAALESFRAISTQYDALGKTLRRGADAASISDETLEELRALGYVK